MTDVDTTLAERAKTYGSFRDIAKISGELQKIMRGTRNWDAMPHDMREALQTICSKIARILNGDCEYIDSWHDIAGYATLIVDRLKELQAQGILKSGDPLAVPPEGMDVVYDPKGDPNRPWVAQKTLKSGARATSRGATRDDAVAQAQALV